MSVMTVVGLLVCVAALPASDWRHWRGPDANGYSAEKGLATTWKSVDGDDENIVWKTPLPDVSGATPIIAGDQIFLTVAEEDDLSLWALTTESGSVVWRKKLGSGNRIQRKHNMSSPSPVTDGERVYALTGTGVLSAFSVGGDDLWSVDLQEEFGPFGLNHGYASSPLLDGDSLYVQVLHGMKTDDPSYVVAFDASNGNVRWRVERPTDAQMESPDSYTTPAIVSRDGTRELVITGGNYATGHALDSGEELWRHGGFNPSASPMYRVVASPVVVGNRVIVPTRVKPMKVLQVDAGGASELWSIDRGPDVPTPASDGSVVYVLRDRGIVSRYDASSGEADWDSQRIAAGTYSSSPVVADGKVYLTSEEGVTTVLRDADEFEVLAENTTDGYTLSSLAIADSKIYLRTAEYLYCIDD